MRDQLQGYNQEWAQWDGSNSMDNSKWHPKQWRQDLLGKNPLKNAFQPAIDSSISATQTQAWCKSLSRKHNLKVIFLFLREILLALTLRSSFCNGNQSSKVVFKYILRFQYLFCCAIIYYDMWNQLIVKPLSNHDMVW